MSRSYMSHKCISFIIYEATNYLITVPICQSRSEEIGNALIENVISKYLCARLYNDGSRLCIYVITHELLIHEAQYKKNSYIL